MAEPRIGPGNTSWPSKLPTFGRSILIRERPRWNLDSDALGLAPAQASRSALASGASGWGPLCEPAPTFVRENMTLFRRAVSGPEDPKLLSLGDDSSDPGDSSMAGPSPWGIVFSSLPPASTSGPSCASPPNQSAVPQMYVMSNGQAAAAAAAAAVTSDSGDTNTGLHAGHSGEGAAVGVRLACGDALRPEKNWIGFRWQGSLYFAYSVEPHVVINARATDGACSPQFSSSFEPLALLTQQGGAKLHGSGTALRYDRDGVEQFLAVFHVTYSTGQYTSFAYTFAAAPPFNVLSVSAALPLQGTGARNFVSGLLLPPGSRKVVITYGASDAESRALVCSEDYFDELFDCDRKRASPPPPAAAGAIGGGLR